MNDVLSLLDRFLVISHVIAGTAGLIFAPIALLISKGSIWHRRSGWVFFWCMVWIFVSTIGLAFFRFSFFLTVVAVVSMYAALTGIRALQRRGGNGPSALDWVAAILSLGLGTLLTMQTVLGFAGIRSDYQPAGADSIVGLIFGLGTAISALHEISIFRRKLSGLDSIRRHGGQMGGAYTAMVTAFLVQNVMQYLPANLMWITWVAPGILATITLPLLLKPYQSKRA
jgi:hypothetical protein